MFTERHGVEGTIEYRVAQMTPAKRVERVRQLNQKAENSYLPQYETALKTIDSRRASLSRAVTRDKPGTVSFIAPAFICCGSATAVSGAPGARGCGDTDYNFPGRDQRFNQPGLVARARP